LRAVGRAIRVGLERCRICSGVAATADRFCDQCAACVEAGDREGLADRAAAQLITRFGPIGKDRAWLRRAAMRGHEQFFVGGTATGPGS
jgi:hypothetical protein